MDSQAHRMVERRDVSERMEINDSRHVGVDIGRAGR